MNEQTRITLAKVKYAAFASEETLCFEATVLFDGNPVCIVSNDGHGGADRHHALKGETFQQMYARLDPVNAYIATLPPVKLDTNTIAADLELVVGDLMNEWLIARDLDRALGKKWLYTVGDEAFPVYFLPKAKVTDPAKWAEAFQRQHNKAPRFLHTLPRAEALAIYRRAAQ
jgi:hypothetical protein